MSEPEEQAINPHTGKPGGTAGRGAQRAHDANADYVERAMKRLEARRSNMENWEYESRKERIQSAGQNAGKEVDVFDIAKEQRIDTKAVVETMRELGMSKPSLARTLTPEEANRLRDHYNDGETAREWVENTYLPEEKAQLELLGEIVRSRYPEARVLSDADIQRIALELRGNPSAEADEVVQRQIHEAGVKPREIESLRKATRKRIGDEEEPDEDYKGSSILGSIVQRFIR